MFAELSTKEISESREPDTFEGHIQAAADGGSIARNARHELEAQTGKEVITPLNAKAGIKSMESGKKQVFHQSLHTSRLWASWVWVTALR